LSTFLLYVGVSFCASAIGGSLALGAVLITTPLLGLISAGTLDFKQIGLLNLILVLSGTFASAITHRHNGYLDRTLLLHIAPTVAVGSLAGGILAHTLSDDVLRWTFAAVALTSLLLGLLPDGGALATSTARVLRSPAVAQDGEGRWYRLAGFCSVSSFVSGLIGIGGGLLITPFLLKLARFPIKTVIGTMTSIGVVTTVCALVGRVGTSPFPPLPSIAGVVLGALLGGVVGAHIGHVLPSKVLTPVLSITIILSAGEIIRQTVTSI